DLHKSSQVHQHEKEIAHLVFDLFARTRLPRRLQLAQLLAQFFEHLGSVTPVESDAGGARGYLLRFDQRRKSARHGVEQRGCRLVTILLSLYVAPYLADVVAGRGGLAAEHMRVPAHEL